MFRKLAPFEPSDDDLTCLAATMIEPLVDVEEPDAPSNNEDVPAGFTYLGLLLHPC
jgi:hypothetical protein